MATLTSTPARTVAMVVHTNREAGAVFLRNKVSAAFPRPRSDTRPPPRCVGCDCIDPDGGVRRYGNWEREVRVRLIE